MHVRVCFALSSSLLVEDLVLHSGLAPKIGINSRRVVLELKYHSPFHQQGLLDALNQSEACRPTLDLFHLNMTTIMLQKIRSISLLFSGRREGVVEVI